MKGALRLRSMKWTKKHTLVSIIILCAGFLIRLLPLLPPEINIIRHVPDDAYYLFCEADNFAHGKGLSFDGVNPTTTSRPLYVVFLAGIDCIVGRSALPQLAYLLGGIADILTALLILRFLRKVGIPPVAAIWGMVFYISSARIIFYGVNGMETPLAILSIVTLLSMYQLKHKPGASSVYHAIAKGAIIAMMMLLRLDYIFMVVPVLCYELWLGITRRNWDWLWVGITSGLIMLPWVWWSLATNGSLMPPSGDALTMVFAPNLIGGLEEFNRRFFIFLNASNSSLYLILFPFKYYYISSVVLTLMALLLVLYKFEIKNKYNILEVVIAFLLLILSIAAMLDDTWRLIGNFAIIIALIYIFIILIRRYEDFMHVLLAIAPLAIGFIALTLYYTAIRLYIRPWNTIEGGVFLSISLGAFCAILMKRRFRTIYIVLLLGWVMIPSFIIASETLDKGPYPSQERFFRAAMWVRDNTPSGTVIAAANGGIIQWYGGRTVVDAAGIEDIEAYKALKAHKLYDYLKLRDVKYLVDPQEWPFQFYADYWGIDMHEKLEEVYNTDPLNEDIYRIPAYANIKPIVYTMK